MIEIINNPASVLCIQSSGQVAKSEAFAVLAMADADWGRNALHVFDKEDKAHEFVNERVTTNIATSSYLTRRVSSTDNVGQKKVGRGFVYYRGATLSKAASVAADTLILDELDLMDKQVASFYVKRLNAAKKPKLRKLSNPHKGKGSGINKEVMAGTQSYWHITCDACGHDAALLYQTHVDEAAGIVRCPGCKRPIDRLKPGHWVAHNPDGEYPSYFINGLMSPIFNLAQVIKDLHSPDPTVRRAATIMDLGIPYEDSETGLNAAEVALCNSNQNSSVYAPGGFMAVDPGGLFDVQIFRKPEPGQPMTCIWVGAVRGWAELADLERQSGVQFGCIDHAPELDATLSWCDARAGRWKRVNYRLQGTGGPRYKFTRDRHMIDSNRTLMCEWFVTNIRAKGKYSPGPKAPPGIVYPRDMALDPDSRLVSHLTALQRVLEPNDDGSFTVRWDHDANRPDHQFHCGIFALICFEAVLSRQVAQGSGDGADSF